jgi:hypothetical protein
MTWFEPERFLRVKVGLLTLFVTTANGELTPLHCPFYSTPNRYERLDRVPAFLQLPACWQQKLSRGLRQSV